MLELGWVVAKDRRKRSYRYNRQGAIFDERGRDTGFRLKRAAVRRLIKAARALRRRSRPTRRR